MKRPPAPSTQPVTRGGQDYRWQPVPGRVLNFGAIFSPDVDQDRVVAYAYTTINVTEETKAVLAMGADDAVRAYLNGEKVYEFARPYGSYLDNHTANVTLKQGENHLLLKVFDAVQDWGAFARFTPDVPSPLQLNFKYPFNEKLGIYELPPVLIRFADAAGDDHRGALDQWIPAQVGAESRLSPDDSHARHASREGARPHR
jgi:hypothetical protein